VLLRPEEVEERLADLRAGHEIQATAKRVVDPSQLLLRVGWSQTNDSW
jgi:hypothetical protein